ncbi:hypothetical protein SAICODRAFT_29867 [Saitoella complicata NRRL Y-17804]|uniref:Uncharacterized protein n=1 Tax=Saitoella complicata (strain BCRC 22490 / CBS 7301 / JCM 7358 / NBRC 10748 / NRRL Y-17804) TaxID=698492 RepID=A0A0E9NAJ0_SAICN|nr:uncharacterized protein SAICODRAFT_29867 [Saitoella complicata NRRL Y-17804]ODQ53914.1 hypothetical protein SAICODRAFT_29867 [Saitoella complicata NRRL Y-17804]GAO46872.1 hypothetical protein G7K_1090-t1 [Saitoella complicata NRRL Y-17804]
MYLISGLCDLRICGARKLRPRRTASIREHVVITAKHAKRSLLRRLQPQETPDGPSFLFVRRLRRSRADQTPAVCDPSLLLTVTRRIKAHRKRQEAFGFCGDSRHCPTVHELCLRRPRRKTRHCQKHQAHPAAGTLDLPPSEAFWKGSAGDREQKYDRRSETTDRDRQTKPTNLHHPKTF